MASAEYTALINKVATEPYDVVRLTLEDPIGAGSTTILLCDARARWTNLRLGVDVLPLILKIGGVSVSLDPTGPLGTLKGLRAIECRDWASYPEDFDVTKALATTGGSFFERLLVAYPSWHRSKVEHLGTFDDPTMDTLTKAEPMFIGQLEDVDFIGDNDTKLVISDVYALKTVQIPSAIGDTNALTVAVLSTDKSFFVSSPQEFPNPQEDYPSVDWLAPVLVLEPGTADEERILISHKGASDELICVPNFLSDTEDLSGAAWTTSSGTGTVTGASAAGPWGPENGTLIVGTSGTFKRKQSSSKTAASGAVNGSIWFREHPDNPGATIFIRVEDSTNTQSAELAIVLTDYWQRFDIGKIFTGAATGTVQVLYGYNSGGPKSFYATQAQLVDFFDKTFWAAPIGGTGNVAGRGAFGTTRIAHSIADLATEYYCGRRQSADSDSAAEGLHPIWFGADQLNRTFIPPSWQDPKIHLSNFQAEADFVTSSRFRRIIKKPKTTKDTLAQIQRQYLFSLWPHRLGYMACRLAWHLRDFGTSYPILSRDLDMVAPGAGASSFSTGSNKASQYNAVQVWYSLRSSGGQEERGDRPEDFDKVETILDVSPAAVGEDFRSFRAMQIFAPWIYRTAEARALGGRVLSRYRLGARMAKATIGFSRFLEVEVGDTVRLDHPRFRALQSGAAISQQPLFQVVEVDYQPRAGDMPMTFLEANQLRYAHVTPTAIGAGGGISSGGTFPDEYDDATPAQQEFYGFVGDTDNKVGAAKVDGYHVR